MYCPAPVGTVGGQIELSGPTPTVQTVPALQAEGPAVIAGRGSTAGCTP